MNKKVTLYLNALRSLEAAKGDFFEAVSEMFGDADGRSRYEDALPHFDIVEGEVIASMFLAMDKGE